jgi:LuxR family maltose regulon positive regulatory protein
VVQGEAGQGADGLSGVSRSKISAPRLRSPELPRRALLDRLDGADARLVVLRGPAGAGKTTLARQWVARDRRPAAWLTLDAADDDPVRFVRNLVAALDAGAAVPEAVAAAAAPHPDVEDGVLAALGRCWDAGPDRILVVDDAQELQSPEALAVLRRVLDMVPDGSTAVVCSRALPAIRWARRLAGGDAQILGGQDLAYSHEEAAEVVHRALPGLAPEAVSSLIEVTGGWPAALQLAVLAIRGRPDAARRVPDLPLRDPALQAYFHDEVLAGLDPDDRAFLVRTSVLEQLCGSLCDAVVEGEGSGDRLERLASSENLFVAGLDDDGMWYRYHALFRELLLAELRSPVPGEEPRLRRRAAEWLSTAGHADAAVRQAVGSGDPVLAGRVAVEHLMECMNAGQTATVEGWLLAAGETMVAESAGLAVSAGWVALTRGRGEELDQRLRLLRDLPPADGSTDQLQKARDALFVVSGSGGTTETHAAARRLVALGPVGNPWWTLAALLEAVTGHMLGELPDPRERLAFVASASAPLSTIDLVARSQLALFDLRSGDRGAGQRLALELRRQLDESNLAGFPLNAIVLAVAALAEAQLGRTNDWRHSADLCRGHLLSLSGSVPRAQVQQRLVLAEAALAGRDVPLARRFLEEAEPYRRQEPDVVLLHDWARDLGDRVASRLASRGGVVDELTEAELRVLDHLATHWTLGEIGQHLYVSRNTVKSHTIAIYRKLGVSGRSAAVEQARNVGLLDR